MDEIECPCCGDVGAVADSDGRFWDGQELVCGCPGQVSCDVETEPDISINDLECVACRLRGQLKIAIKALEEYADQDNWARVIGVKPEVHNRWFARRDGWEEAQNALDAIQKLDEPLPETKPTTRAEQRAFLEFAEEHERLMAEQPNSMGMIDLNLKCPSCGSDPDVDCICKGQNG